MRCKRSLHQLGATARLGRSECRRPEYRASHRCRSERSLRGFRMLETELQRQLRISPVWVVFLGLVSLLPALTYPTPMKLEVAGQSGVSFPALELNCRNTCRGISLLSAMVSI